MEKLYYVIEKEFQLVNDNGGIEETSGWKDITVYNIDTQAMHSVEVCQIRAENTSNSEVEIQTWLDNQDPEATSFNFTEEYEFVRLE